MKKTLFALAALAAIVSCKSLKNEWDPVFDNGKNKPAKEAFYTDTDMSNKGMRRVSIAALKALYQGKPTLVGGNVWIKEWNNVALISAAESTEEVRTNCISSTSTVEVSHALDNCGNIRTTNDEVRLYSLSCIEDDLCTLSNTNPEAIVVISNRNADRSDLRPSKLWTC